ncbi:MAG: hypothetical protein SGI88_07600 [Candidatus Hydrogenedentes bacterium]|nr:hypothetical protein [Candidatus Hydrogenedentota bacterium]
MARIHRPARHLVSLFLFAVVITGGTIGCGAPPSTASPSAASPPAAKAGGFPEDFPVYEGLVQDYVSDSGPLLVVNGVTDDDIPKVISFYRDRMPVKGWIEGTDPAQGGGGAEELVYTKGPAKAVILVSKDLGKTRVSVQVEGYEPAR